MQVKKQQLEPDMEQKTGLKLVKDYVKTFVWITTNCGKFFKRWECQTTWPASWEICMQVRKQQLELDMEQQTGSKKEKEMSRLYIVTLPI